MADLGKAYVQIIPSADGLSGSISVCSGCEKLPSANKIILERSLINIAGFCIESVSTLKAFILPKAVGLQWV